MRSPLRFQTTAASFDFLAKSSKVYSDSDCSLFIPFPLFPYFLLQLIFPHFIRTLYAVQKNLRTPPIKVVEGKSIAAKFISSLLVVVVAIMTVVTIIVIKTLNIIRMASITIIVGLMSKTIIAEIHAAEGVTVTTIIMSMATATNV